MRYERRGIRAQPWFRRAWYVGRALIGNRPALLPALKYAPGTPADYVVSSDSDVCIEGFSRSGNGFAVSYFRQFNPRARIAHHVHLPAQLLVARRHGVPRILLVRRPRDSVVSSLVAYDGVIGADLLLRGYVAYHRRLLAHLDDIPVCRFEELTATPDVLVERLNERFGTRFDARRLTPADAAGLMDGMRGSAAARGYPPRAFSVPAPEKEELKARWRQAVEGHRLLGHATAIHETVVRRGSSA